MEDSTKFRTMFVVDPQVSSFKDGETIGSDFTIKKEHPFNIHNRQAIEKGEIIERGTYRRYMMEVIFGFFDTLKVSQIRPFLSYHYENAKDKTALLDFINYDIWDWFTPPLELSAHRESAIKEWIESVKTPDKLIGMKRKDIYGDAALKNLFTELVNGGMLKQKDKAGFLKAFDPDSVFDCEPIRWEGSNPELATLIVKFTTVEIPVPSLVNKYFDPKYKYSNNSKDKNRLENPKIKKILNLIK